MKKSILIYYTLIQSLYWVSLGLTFSFASSYLLSRGLPNGHIGLVLAIAYVLAAFLQPLIASIIDRWQIPLAKAVVAIYGLSAVLSVALFALPLPVAGVLTIMAIDFALLYGLQSCVNSLAEVLTKINRPVNFGAARGACSLIFAIMMVIVGYVLRKVSPLFLPLSYAAITIVGIILLVSFPALLQGKLQIAAAVNSGFPAIRKYPAFWIFLGSTFFLAIGQSFFDSFLLQIMQNVGGDSGDMGLASGINSAVEFLPMLFFTTLSKKFGVKRLMLLAAWAWIVKTFMVFTAASPTAIFVASFGQSITYALFIPGSIELVSKMLPEKYFLKGQSLAVSAFTIGSVVSSVFGGVFLDTIGVTKTLGLIVLLVALGAVLMTISSFWKTPCESVL